MILSSVDSLSGSRLNLKVPVNIVGSCGITVIFFLTSLSGSSYILTPSIRICPPAISTILLSERHIVLLPAPVLPTTPIFSLGFTSKVRLFRTISVFGLYLKTT